MRTDCLGWERLEDRVFLSAGSDPITTDHPLWAIPHGAAVIDGELDDAGWASAFVTTRSLAFREGTAASVYAMYDGRGIYLATDVKDARLWADGGGGGAGDLWQLEQDDSVTFYFDLDGSREEYLQADDYAFGYSIGNFTDPTNDADGPVRRFKFVKGDGAGSGTGVGWFGDDWGAIEARGEDPEDYYLPTGAAYATTYDGTLNDDSDVDTGWTSELFLPWSAFGVAAPAHGLTMGMNFDIILDDSGGERDMTRWRWSQEKWDHELIADDHMVGVHGSASGTGPGINGPVNYAEVMFIDSRAGQVPATIDDLAIAGITGYSARLAFSAPAGTTTGLGHVSAYQIRYSTSPIASDRDWLEAAAFENRYTPRLAGKDESLRLIGLQPGATYWVAIRAMDGAGNVGGMAVETFTTQTTAQDRSAGTRLVPSPLGRMMVTESGEPFIAVGDHLGLSWAFTRQMYPGDVWDNANGIFQNFYGRETLEGPYEDYLDSLQARGINTMRVYIELQSTHSDGNPALPESPRGTYWLEHTPGEFNEDMHDFVDLVMEEAAERGMYLIISAFQPYFWDDAFGTEGPWSTAFGGPLSDLDNFFQTPETLTIAKNRMTEVAGWVKSSPYAHRVMGYEMLSEWNASGWTLNPEGDSSPGRAAEYSRRAQWIGELARHTRAVDPQRLVLNSTVIEDPRGPIARSLFYSRDFDVLTPHFYTRGGEEPINNPSSDRSVVPAVEGATVTAHWLHMADDRRPILNGEWGLVGEVWPGGTPYYTDQTYMSSMPSTGGKTYTMAEDEELYNAVLWSAIASGQFGTPLRMASTALSFVTGYHDNGYAITQGFILNDHMRGTQQAIATWVANSAIGFDFARYSPDPLTGRLAVSAPGGHTLHAMGASDGSQGIVFILQDRDALAGAVTGARVDIVGLEADAMFDIEIWSTDSGTDAPLSVVEGVFSADGSLSVDLPAFSPSLVLRFKARRAIGQVEEIVALRAGSKTVTFARGLDGQPVASITDGATGAVSTVDIAALTNFRARAVDMTPYVTPNGVVHLAVTDERHHLWVFHGNLADNTWTLVDMTAQISAPGMSGDLTVYQPSWNAIHITGLDGRGHAVAYWWAPGMEDWAYSDLTELFDGPTMRGGLAGFVSGWDGLNIAGLNDAGEVVVYWWAPGLGAWQTVNMTQSFDGPTLSGQLSAFTTPWGALNITGLNAEGETVAYWWVPGMGEWKVANLTRAAGAPTFSAGVTAAMSTDGGINLFGLDAEDHLVMLRFSLVTSQWSSTDVTQASGAAPIDFPAAAASAGGLMTVGGRTRSEGAQLVLHTMDLGDDLWTWQLGASHAVS
ncbi:MAG TPA: hypothetical protein VFF69_01585 [Phycisphaerales bacterium]|nr:hypothetical protein [Phycisphaerales bacterium]